LPGGSSSLNGSGSSSQNARSPLARLPVLGTAPSPPPPSAAAAAPSPSPPSAAAAAAAKHPHHPNPNQQPPSRQLQRRLDEAQALVAQFSETNARLARENDRLRAGRSALGAEHAAVLDEIDVLRGKLGQLEASVLSKAGAAAAAGHGGGGGGRVAAAAAAVLPPAPAAVSAPPPPPAPPSAARRSSRLAAGGSRGNGGGGGGGGSIVVSMADEATLEALLG
jgi:hypothetical protein